MKQKKLISAVAGTLAILMIFGLTLNIIPTNAVAADSSVLESEISDLEHEAQEIQKAKEALSEKQAETSREQQNLVDRKIEIDQEIKLIHDEIHNINERIQSYNQLISEKQKELDGARVRLRELNVHYRERIRAMEENGPVSYWAVLFRSSSFSEFLGNMSMVSEIARADQRMMEELKEAAETVETAQTELAEGKNALEAQRTALHESQAELDSRSEEATKLLTEINHKAHDMAETLSEYEAQAEGLSDELAQKEQEYTEALKEEEEERQKQEETEKEEKENQGSGDDSGPIGGSASGWGYPLPYRARITSPYGWRVHPITGNPTSFHTGVDLGADSGDPIYAVRSGYITTAEYSEIYGYYVMVNHGDGFSTMSAHMTHYVVSVGEYVEQGQIIGYVGTTGLSDGPHLHFAVYYNGNHVNPMDYI